MYSSPKLNTYLLLVLLPYNQLNTYVVFCRSYYTDKTLIHYYYRVSTQYRFMYQTRVSFIEWRFLFSDCKLIILYISHKENPLILILQGPIFSECSSYFYYYIMYHSWTPHFFNKPILLSLCFCLDLRHYTLPNSGLPLHPVGNETSLIPSDWPERKNTLYCYPLPFLPYSTYNIY